MRTGGKPFAAARAAAGSASGRARRPPLEPSGEGAAGPKRRAWRGPARTGRDAIAGRLAPPPGSLQLTRGPDASRAGVAGRPTEAGPSAGRRWGRRVRP